MFSKKDIESIDRKYFRVINAGCFCVTIQSRNTQHCWYILHNEYPHFSSCTIYHTHHEGTPYHEHGHGKTLKSCMMQIRSHDAYQLKKDACRHQKKKNIHRAEALTANL